MLVNGACPGEQHVKHRTLDEQRVETESQGEIQSAHDSLTLGSSSEGRSTFAIQHRLDSPPRQVQHFILQIKNSKKKKKKAFLFQYKKVY